MEPLNNESVGRANFFPLFGGFSLLRGTYKYIEELYIHNGRVIARNVLKEGADKALDTLTSICALDNLFAVEARGGGVLKKRKGEVK